MEKIWRIMSCKEAVDTFCVSRIIISGFKVQSCVTFATTIFENPVYRNAIEDDASNLGHKLILAGVQIGSRLCRNCFSHQGHSSVVLLGFCNGLQLRPTLIIMHIDMCTAQLDTCTPYCTENELH